GEAENAAFFESAAEGQDAKAVANMVIGSVFAGLNKADLDIADSPVSAAQVGQLVGLIADDTVSGRSAKEVFELMFEDGPDQGKNPAVIIEEKGLKQVTDTGAIEAAVDEVIDANPDKVAQAKERPKMAGWFVGQVMQATGGKANPQAVNKLVMLKLGLE
ncbi:Asp-tRNA(Asn)/Glu-tRNA(Gln) amidotransferase GatCAB subunit B, partial [Alphaproteobacteria bacterium]|nr:Asp-tRNA(Asn)/Glu-tRNA(Gln) amidotransferase GatCAB subunit B [Alphaproteobacteria bacterium]